MTNAVPLVDISPWFSGDEKVRDAVAAAVDKACVEWGFLILAGHQIDAGLIETMSTTSKSFFDLPLADKLKVDASGSVGGRGYYRMEAKSLARTLGDKNAPGDLRESFRIGVEAVATDARTTSPEARGHFADNRWPQQPRELQQVWSEYYRACDALSTELMRICARALKMPDDYFDAMIDRSTSNIVAQHYPPLDREPVPGQVRNGAHTDFGTLTLLLAEDRPGGLQLKGLDGDWHDIKPIPGTYIVNLGDMMAQWTNDRWRSTLHRVVNPPADSGSASRRLSVVFFHTPNFDATIACIPSCVSDATPAKYKPIQAGEHIAQKLRAVESVSKAS